MNIIHPKATLSLCYITNQLDSCSFLIMPRSLKKKLSCRETFHVVGKFAKSLSVTQSLRNYKIE